MLDGMEIPGFASILYGVWDLEVSAVKQSVEKDCTSWLYMYTLNALVALSMYRKDRICRIGTYSL